MINKIKQLEKRLDELTEKHNALVEALRKQNAVLNKVLGNVPDNVRQLRRVK